MKWFERNHHVPQGGRARDSSSFYHLSFRSGSRASGSCATAAFAYVTRTGEYDDPDRDAALYTESDHLPAWSEDDPRDYWDAERPAWHGTPEDRLAAAPAVLAEVQRVYASMADPLDLPRTLTERQFQTYATLWRNGESFAVYLPSMIDLLRDVLGRRQHAQQEIARLEAIGHRLEAEAEAQPKTAASEAALLAEFRALKLGVEYDDRTQPLLPLRVRAALTRTCASCGHGELTWTGSIAHWQNEERRLERAVADADQPLRATLEQAANWLAEIAERTP